MLSELGDVPRVKVIFDLQPPLVLEALAMLLRRGMDSPLFRGGELFDEVVPLEEFDDLLAHAPGDEGPHLRSLHFALEGGIDDGLL